MHTSTPAEIHTATHAARTTELAAEAAAWHLAHATAPAAPDLRDRLGEALISAGIRLMQPAHVHARIAQTPHSA
ncbi:hypothetical protein [Streptomyces sp. NPDC097981]|uniref:hypothetical protein n=1 Tax=Streptomyces sp. NPDC097981 TaxID=3155428 RepID=UPI0033255EB6